MLLAFYLKMLVADRDLLKVLCCNITGLVYSSVEIIKAESLNSTVLFTNNSSTISDLYGNVTNLTVTEDPLTDNENKLAEFLRLREIVRLMDLSALPPFIVLGTLGNALAFIVMRRGSMRHVSTCFYMAILALADTGQ